MYSIVCTLILHIPVVGITYSHQVDGISTLALVIQGITYIGCLYYDILPVYNQSKSNQDIQIAMIISHQYS